ncbi:MAG: ribosome-associated translation inhibitor RaiA [Tissierellales bacterium]|jgi:putative sigma-54 modulation protein|nr:ribosome-associated translation inhibitor RaiA [Tissierellales bacterium]MBN2827752.1 ribosome-associated translation inhibitor RaiA [Tissierellales bacterium]
MNTKIFGKNISITDSLKETVEKKISKLDKYFFKDVEVKVVLSVEKLRQIIEITVPFSGTVIRAEEVTDDMYNSIDNAVDALERQIRKHKTKLQNKKHNQETIRFENIEPLEFEEEESKIVKTKRFAMKPMSVEEAALQMDLVNHNFYVFLNAETEEVNVVYKRKDNNVGLIEPEL